MNKVTFENKDGLQLAGVWHLPTQSTQKAIVLAHGITADKNESGTFIDLANSLQSNGFAVFRFDFRAHGESEGKPIELTIGEELKDLQAAMGEVTKKGF